MAMIDDLSQRLIFPELEFDDGGHIYRLNGEVIPSVSTVMEPLKNATYSGIPKRTMEKAADKGTSVHNSIENFVKFGIEDVNPMHKGYFDAFMGWWNDAKPVVVGSEIRIYHRILQYGGTIDLLAYTGDELTLIDFKSTQVVSDMSCGVQLEAYSQALASHGIRVAKKMILHLKKDGKYATHGYPANDTTRWRVFTGSKCLYDYIQSYK